MKVTRFFIILLFCICPGRGNAQSLAGKVRSADPVYHRLDSLRNLYRGHGFADATATVKIKNYPALRSNKDGNSFTAAACNGIFCTSFVVPVTGMELTGIRQDNEQVLLNWKTYSEYNDIGFDIERSFTGLNGSFDYIGFVTGAGNSNTELHYSKQDKNNYKGISYYRLKQRDVNGHFTYSNIAPVKGYSTAPELNIYPNPGTNPSILFYISGLDARTNVSITITDAPGRLIMQKNNFVLENGGLYLNRLVNLPAGFYNISFSNEAIHLRGSFVITR